jgi:hypothetical protein
VEQERVTLLEHVSSPPVFSGARVARFLVFCGVFFGSLFVILAIALSVLVRLTVFGYPFDILKLLMYSLSYARHLYCQLIFLFIIELNELVINFCHVNTLKYI